MGRQLILPSLFFVVFDNQSIDILRLILFFFDYLVSLFTDPYGESPISPRRGSPRRKVRACDAAAVFHVSPLNRAA